MEEKVYTDRDYRFFYCMMSYSDFLKNLADGTLHNHKIS